MSLRGGPDELYDVADDAANNPTFYADITNPQSLNKYQYTYNNPLNMTDADGYCPICVVAASAAVVAYIVLSPQTVHAPTPKDTYREWSASSAAQIVSLGLARSRWRQSSPKLAARSYLSWPAELAQPPNKLRYKPNDNNR